MKKYKTAIVLGNGRSGSAAEALLHRDGTDVVCLSDETTPEYGYEDLRFIPDVAIVSPGFSLKHPWVLDLKARGIPLVSELEFGWSRRNCPVIAVTGSNGKSTVVKWIVDALNQVGLRGVPCGNYGFPVSAAVMLPETPDWLIIEVSSFHLETVTQFHPEIGLLLNVLPNHLDRHGDMETYRALKLRLFGQMDRADTAILPFDFFGELKKAGQPIPGFEKTASSAIPSLKTFGTRPEADYCFSRGHVGNVNLTGSYFDNEILGAAGAAVVAVCEACGVVSSAVEASARNFKPLPHRTELVAEINGVRFVDDSKATNLAGMCAALRMVQGPVHLIAGGRAKETDFSFAKDLLVQQVSRLYLIGEASGAMQSAWGDSVDCLPCETLEQAVSAASRNARPGEIVLLSPACTSFDQFCSFNERGEQFARQVNRLKSECRKA